MFLHFNFFPNLSLHFVKVDKQTKKERSNQSEKNL